jgi:hypothetical protein
MAVPILTCEYKNMGFKWSWYKKEWDARNEDVEGMFLDMAFWPLRNNKIRREL